MWFERYAHRQTDRQTYTHIETDTQMCSLQYFIVAAAGEVIMAAPL